MAKYGYDEMYLFERGCFFDVDDTGAVVVFDNINRDNPIALSDHELLNDVYLPAGSYFTTQAIVDGGDILIDDEHLMCVRWELSTVDVDGYWYENNFTTLGDVTRFIRFDLNDACEVGRLEFFETFV